MATSRHGDSQQGSGSRKTASLVLAAVVAAAVLIVSFLPVQDKRRIHSGGRLHFWGHFAVFSVVGYVAARAAHSRRARILAFVLAVAFGFGIEIGEHLVFHSALEWKDVLVDALGVIAGTAASMASAPQAVDSRY